MFAHRELIEDALRRDEALHSFDLPIERADWVGAYRDQCGLEGISARL